MLTNATGERRADTCDLREQQHVRHRRRNPLGRPARRRRRGDPDDGAMAARGPDSDGVVAHGPVALGHRRLKIIDLSAPGAQPMVDSDLGLTLVFNGCIYNHQELRASSRPRVPFFSPSDTEVILKAFPRWGTDCVDHFKGMFAFAVADRDSGVVSSPATAWDQAALPRRDRRRLRFASTLPALLAGGGVDTELDPVALHHYMSFHSVVPAPRTVSRGVRKLPPATVRVIEPDGAHTDTVYWAPPFERDPDADVVVGARLAGRADGRAAHRGRAAHGRRRPGRRPAVGRHRLVDRGRPAGRAGPARPRDVQHRLRLSRRRDRRRVRLLRPDRAHTSTPTTTASTSTAPGCCPPCRKPSPP